MNNLQFYVVYAYIHVSEQYEIVGIFSKKEDADDFLESYPESEFVCNCIEQLSINEIKTVLVKERLLTLSEVLEPLMDRLLITDELNESD